MAIRFRDANAFVGRIRATLGDAVSAFTGAHTGPAARTGTIATALGQFVPALVGAFQNATRTGTIASVLQPFAASVTGPISASIWDNWPSMNGACHQASSTTHILDPTRWAELAEKNLLIVQSFNATDLRSQDRLDAVAGIKSINPGIKILWYQIPQETIKALTAAPDNDPLEVSHDLIDDPVNGNPNWLAHRVGQTGDAGRVESNFPPTGTKTRWNCNMAALVAGLNSLGENYATAYWKAWYAAYSSGVNFLPAIDGFFIDNFNARPPSMFQNNGALTVTDQDYNQNGVADGRVDYSAGPNAGGRFWAEGHLEFKARMESKFGASKILCPNSARFKSDYTDGLGSPPTPISSHPYYQKFDVLMPESTNLQLGLQIGSTSYTFNGGGSVSSFYGLYNINERMLKPDAQNTRTGKGAVLLHALCVSRSAPTADDLAYARFICGLTMLVERGAMCVMQSAALPLSLDETLIELGNPLAVRTMGTLNESSPGGTFPLRLADITVSGNTIHYALFEKGGWFVNTTSPTIGAYPSADAAVAFTLPTPPAGKKWQRYNSLTYENPTTHRSMRGQDTALNNGIDVTTATLKRYHAIALRLVSS